MPAIPLTSVIFASKPCNSFFLVLMFFWIDVKWVAETVINFLPTLKYPVMTRRGRVYTEMFLIKRGLILVIKRLNEPYY